MNPDFEKWIVGSLTKWFSDVCVANSVPFVSEDFNEDTTKLDTWVTLRVPEHQYRKNSAGNYVVNVDIDLLVTSKPKLDDTYRVHEITGILIAACDSIPVYQIVSGNPVLWFCLELDREMVSPVRKIYFGQEFKTKTKFASVLAFFESEVNLT